MIRAQHTSRDLHLFAWVSFHFDDSHMDASWTWTIFVYFSV